MSVYSLDIDSSERDPIVYENPNDYVIKLKNPIYNVTKISLISARIHASQLLINDRNNTFTIDNTTVILDNNNYNGKTLAAELVQKSSNITSAVYDSNTNVITMTGAQPFTMRFYDGTNGYNTTVNGMTTPHDILGLPAKNVSSVGNTLTTGSINLQGPDALILKLSSGSDEFNKTVFSESPFYTGRILMCGDVVNYSGADDTVEHTFHGGPQNEINSLRVQFFYSSNNRLIPYDFRNANHIIKLSIQCTTDKLVNEEKPKLSMRDIKINDEKEDDVTNPRNWNAFLNIFLIVIMGIILLFSSTRSNVYRVTAKRG